MFDDYKISTSTINLLIDRVGNDIGILAQEVEKLKLYKIDTKEITRDDIIACSTLNIDTDIFRFIDNIINKNKKDALNTYYEMLKNNEEPIKIIALLASKFRLMYQAVHLSRKGFNNNEISKILGVHAYPVKLAIEAGIRYPEELSLSYLNSLATLDIEIKTGLVDSKLGLELFIMKV
jgi:DNA polymerase-3 subunit delta